MIASRALRRRGDWLVGSRVFAGPRAREPLEIHADWPGAVKLVGHEQVGALEQRFEYRLPRQLEGVADARLDDDVARQYQELLDELDGQWRRAGKRGVPVPASWEPPEAEQLAAWLAAAGRDAAIDAQGGLRLTLKRRTMDGQVRIERTARRLRFVLPLGCWKGLEDDSRDAMINLAHEANARLRLGRITWKEADGVSRVETVVDLSGMPAGTPVRDACAAGMVRGAVSAMELSLRWLALELAALADKDTGALTGLLAIEGNGPRRRRRGVRSGGQRGPSHSFRA